MRLSRLVAIAVFAGAPLGAQAQSQPASAFEKKQLSNQFWAEGATFGDLNRDGKADLVAGPYWWEGPSLQRRHEYYPATTTFSVTRADGKTETVPGFEGALGEKNS